MGEGGFGVVYMAEQLEPVRRKVALKIIKLGMDTRQVVARFESERQALALMDHPNIARVFDGGATESGRPYFVMELVKGIPITEYCDQNQLSPRERLELFVPVCQAVQHAHQKGIIHRDLKPSNVLVTLHDGRPVPKVIDFGIAKATNQRLTEKTLFTEFRQFIGTPQYMSPEQAEMSGLDVDTRSDIYSLGVLLYELLAGSTPFDAERAAGRRLCRDAADHSRGRSSQPLGPREHDAGRPGGRGAAPARRRRDAAQAAARRYGLDRDEVPGEGPHAALRARPATWRRYPRHLENEPVLASPPSPIYELQKFVRRNRAGVLAGSAGDRGLAGRPVAGQRRLLAGQPRSAASHAGRRDGRRPWPIFCRRSWPRSIRSTPLAGTWTWRPSPHGPASCSATIMPRWPRRSPVWPCSFSSRAT